MNPLASRRPTLIVFSTRCSQANRGRCRKLRRFGLADGSAKARSGCLAFKRGKLIALALTLAFSSLPFASANSQINQRIEAEKLVRAIYYEGMPFDAPQLLARAGIQRLAEMIKDPEEAAHRARIVMALGLSRSPEAFAVLRDYADQAPRGAVAQSELNARLALPIAFGHLARTDSRAYEILERRIRIASPVRWNHGRYDSRRLSEMLYKTRIQAIGSSGLADGAQFIRGLLSQTKDRERKEIMREALDLSERVMSRGAARVYGETSR